MLLEGLILVIDDEFPNRVYLRKLLQKRGCTVLLASNGEEALQLAQERLPDVILVDVVMVGMDGFEVCRRLKANKSTASIPAIMVTAKTSIDDLEKGFEYGASDYIRKPFNPRELLARVKTALALKNAQDKLLQWQAADVESAQIGRGPAAESAGCEPAVYRRDDCAQGQPAL